MNITFFKTSVEFRKWLALHHATARELWVGFYKKKSGNPSITWPESVDQHFASAGSMESGRELTKPVI